MVVHIISGPSIELGPPVPCIAAFCAIKGNIPCFNYPCPEDGGSG